MMNPKIDPLALFQTLDPGGNGLAAKSSDEIGRLGAVCSLRPDTDWLEEELDGRPAAEVLRPRVVVAKATAVRVVAQTVK